MGIKGETKATEMAGTNCGGEWMNSFKMAVTKLDFRKKIAL